MDKDVLALIQWTIGICATGFLFLAGWILYLVQRIKDRPTFEWLEKQFKVEIKTDIGNLSSVLNEIRDALLGDMEREGLISRTRRMQERCVLHKLIKQEVDEHTGIVK